MAAVYGPREVHPRHLQENNKAIVQCRYNMAAFSVDERKRPGLDRRSQEISKVIAEAFESVIFVEEFPRTSIDVYIEVLQANAGTRCAGVVAASVALADAGIPMVDLLPAVAVGKVARRDRARPEEGGGQLRRGRPSDGARPPVRPARAPPDGGPHDPRGALPVPRPRRRRLPEDLRIMKQALRDRYSPDAPARPPGEVAA